MAQQHVNLVAVFTPKAGKKDRLQALLFDLTKQVHASEPDVLRYVLHYQADTQEFVVIERYKDEAAFETHKQQPGFVNLVKTMKEEDLLAKPLDLKILEPIGGHDDR